MDGIQTWIGFCLGSQLVDVDCQPVADLLDHRHGWHGIGDHDLDYRYLIDALYATQYQSSCDMVDFADQCFVSHFAGFPSGVDRYPNHSLRRHGVLGFRQQNACRIGIDYHFGFSGSQPTETVAEFANSRS